MRSDSGYTFECLEEGCDHEKDHRTAIGGALHVFWHYYRGHPDRCFDVGNPLSDASAPDFDGDSGGEGRGE